MNTPTETKRRIVVVQRTCGHCQGDGYREVSVTATGESRTVECWACQGRGFVETEREAE